MQGKICVGRRKVRHFCITTTSQIIGAATAAPAAPLSTPSVSTRTFKNSENVTQIQTYSKKSNAQKGGKT